MNLFKPIFKVEGVEISKNEGQNCQSLKSGEFDSELVLKDF